MNLSEKLARKAINNSGQRFNEIERHCWMVVHEYHHGFIPLEYDIREIDEDLFTSVLQCAKKYLAKPLED